MGSKSDQMTRLRSKRVNAVWLICLSHARDLCRQSFHASGRETALLIAADP